MKYIKKIIIDNFQSHAHTEFDLEPGLNIIVGQSDKGKSAVLRALKWVLYNEPRGTDFIRHGTNECTVTIITGDGYTITRKRKSNKNIYIVIKPDNEKLEFENFGNNVPQEVIEATGIKKVKLDTDTESKLNINQQLDPPFLLSETGSIRAKAIGRIVNTNILDAAERDILKDISNNNVTIKGFEKQLNDIEQELEGYSDILQQEQTLQQIDIMFEKLSSLNLKLQKLTEYNQKLQSINSVIGNNKTMLHELKDLPLISDLTNTLKEKFLIYQRLCNLKDKLKTLEDSISKDKFTLDKIKDLSIIENNIRTVNSKVELYNKINKFNQEYRDILLKINKGNEYTTQVKNELQEKISKYSTYLKQLGKCPTCFCEINESTLNHIIYELEGETNGSN